VQPKKKTDSQQNFSWANEFVILKPKDVLWRIKARFNSTRKGEK
jgi:hypothetical protein